MATEHVVERAYVEDVSGLWTLQDAQSQALTSYAGLLSKGYGKGALWVRLRIDPHLSETNADDHLFLRIRPFYLDDIQIFDNADDQQTPLYLGDSHPLNAQEKPSLFFLHRLKAGDVPRDIWLRIQSTSTRLAHLEVIDESHLLLSSMKVQTFGGVFLALIGFFVVFGIFQSWQNPDALNLSFTLYQCIAFFHGAANLGYSRVWVPEWWSATVLDRGYSFLVVFYVLSIWLYSNHLLRDLGSSKVRLFIFHGLNLVFAGVFILQVLGDIRLSLKINMIISLLITPYFLLATVTHKEVAPAQGSPGKKAMMVYFSLTLFFAYLVVLPNLGWVKGVEFSSYAILLYSLSGGMLMMGMLQYRASLLIQQRESLMHEAQQATQRAELERAQRLERERMIAMLGHELKTPLATLRMMLGDQAIPSQTALQLNEPLHEINEVIERTVQSGQLENNAVDLRPLSCNLVQTLHQSLGHWPQQHRLQWVLLPGATDTPVVTDPFLLGVIVRNLVDNALKYSPDDSMVRISLQADRAHAHWTLEISNLMGRAGQPDPEHVFEKFWRSPQASYRSGSGQGLFIALRLAELMGGHLIHEARGDQVVFILTQPTQVEHSKAETA
jgi:two-component system, sensor histidine kinase LadS